MALHFSLKYYYYYFLLVLVMIAIIIIIILFFFLQRFDPSSELDTNGFFVARFEKI